MPGTAYRREPDQRTRNVIAEVIRSGIKGLESPAGSTFRQRVKRLKRAALWLPSAAAGRWFDAIDLDQRATLERIEYADAVRRRLESDHPLNVAFRQSLSVRERRYLESAVEELG